MHTLIESTRVPSMSNRTPSMSNSACSTGCVGENDISAVDMVERGS